MSLPKKDLRKSRDWVGDRWIDVPVKPDINSFLTSESKLSVSPTISKNIRPDQDVAQDTDMNPGTEQNSADKVKPDSVMTNSDCLSEIKDRTEGMEILPVEDEGNRDDGHHKISDSCDNVKESEKNRLETSDKVGDLPDNKDEKVQEEPEPSRENSKTVEVPEAVA